MLTALIIAATATALVLTAAVLTIVTGRGEPPRLSLRERAELAARLWVM